MLFSNLQAIDALNIAPSNDIQVADEAVALDVGLASLQTKSEMNFDRRRCRRESLPRNQSRPKVALGNILFPTLKLRYGICDDLKLQHWQV